MKKYWSLNSKAINHWFLFQYLGEIIIFGLLIIHNIMKPQLSPFHLFTTITSAFIGILVIIPGIYLTSANEQQLKTLSRFKRGLYQFNHYLQGITQILILPAIINIIMHAVKTSVPFLSNCFFIILLLFSLIMYIPIGVFAISRVQSLLGRILISFSSGILLLGSGEVMLEGVKVTYFLKELAISDTASSLSFVILMGIVMNIWGFALPKFSWSSTANLRIIIFLAILTVGYIFFNTFSTANTFSQLLTHFDFHFKALNLKMFFAGVEPGILEEWLCRYVFLYLLLRALNQKKFQLELAVFSSSLIFGLAHLTNLVAQSWQATLQQIISAWSIGIFFAALYLYTKALWWPILFHAAVDVLEGMITGKSTMGMPTNFDWWVLIIITIILLGISIFLLTGSRRRNIYNNFPEGITYDKQAFI